MATIRQKRFSAGRKLGALTNYLQSSSSGGDEQPADRQQAQMVDSEEADPDQGGIISHIISQLRPGADLSRVTLPTHFLEPRSMLERITNFMAHPELLVQLTEPADPVARFVGVVKFYMTGWHIKPVGVKKPLNPILGETFSAYWDYPDNARGYYISEQTSHHPPKSSYFFMAPHHNIRIDGTLKPRSRFLGNSAASLMEGISLITFLNHNERYFMTQPNIYVRNLIFGRKMRYELGDEILVHCPDTNLVAKIEFKTKGYVSGKYNEISGTIRYDNQDEPLYEIYGLWNEKMFIRDVRTKKEQMFFDASRAAHTPPSVRPVREQAETESQRLWGPVTAAVVRNDQALATDEKTKIEERQRRLASARSEQGTEWRPRLFRPVSAADFPPTARSPSGSASGSSSHFDPLSLDWILAAPVTGRTAEECERQILAVTPILPGQAGGASAAQRPDSRTGSSGSSFQDAV